MWAHQGTGPPAWGTLPFPRVGAVAAEEALTAELVDGPPADPSASLGMLLSPDETAGARFAVVMPGLLFVAAPEDVMGVRPLGSSPAPVFLGRARAMTSAMPAAVSVTATATPIVAQVRRSRRMAWSVLLEAP
jgi:hypothetical protein